MDSGTRVVSDSAQYSKIAKGVSFLSQAEENPKSRTAFGRNVTETKEERAEVRKRTFDEVDRFSNGPHGSKTFRLEEKAGKNKKFSTGVPAKKRGMLDQEMLRRDKEVYDNFFKNVSEDIKKKVEAEMAAVTGDNYNMIKQIVGDVQYDELKIGSLINYKGAFNFNFLHHVGVYVGCGMVIHLVGGVPVNATHRAGGNEGGLAGQAVPKVTISSLSEFKNDKDLEVVNSPDARDEITILSDAFMKVGSEGYDLINYNCEHFANAVVTGEAKSRQSNSILDLAAQGVDVIAGIFGHDKPDPKTTKKTLESASRIASALAFEGSNDKAQPKPDDLSRVGSAVQNVWSFFLKK